MFTFIFKVIGGDVFEQPVTGFKTRSGAWTAVLRLHGVKRSDVILCEERQ